MDWPLVVGGLSILSVLFVAFMSNRTAAALVATKSAVELAEVKSKLDDANVRIEIRDREIDRLRDALACCGHRGKTPCP